MRGGAGLNHTTHVFIVESIKNWKTVKMVCKPPENNRFLSAWFPGLFFIGMKPINPPLPYPTQFNHRITFLRLKNKTKISSYAPSLWTTEPPPLLYFIYRPSIIVSHIDFCKGEFSSVITTMTTLRLNGVKSDFSREGDASHAWSRIIFCIVYNENHEPHYLYFWNMRICF